MTVPALVAYLLYFMIAAVPLEHHAYYEHRGRTEKRYVEIATAIARVALDPDEKPVFDGDRIKTALLLASIASYEGIYRHDITRCEKSGRGNAWGLYQFEGPKEKVCGSLEQATRHALHMVWSSWFVCYDHDEADKLSFYTDGKCIKNWQRSRSRVERALRWWEKYPADFDVDVPAYLRVN